MVQKSLIDPDAIVDLNVANYSHGISVVEARRWVQLSGQVGVAPDGTVQPDFTSQCRQAFENIQDCLAAARMGIDDLVMLRIFLLRREDLAALRAVRADFLGDRRIPSTLVFVAGLVNPSWLVELEVAAAAD